MFRFITFVAAAVVFSLLMVPVFFIVWVFTVPFDSRKRRALHKVSYFWSYFIYKLHPKWKINIIGKENIVPGQNYVVLSNHQAMFDIPLIMHTGLNIVWVSKREIYNIPFFGLILLMRDDVAIKRGTVSSAKMMIKKCSKKIKNGLSIAMFPEGTRTKTGEMGKFLSGAFLLASRAQCPILPIAIDGTFDALNSKTPRKKTFTISIAKPIMTEEIKTYTMEQLRDKTEEIIKNQINTICQK